MRQKFLWAFLFLLSLLCIPSCGVHQTSAYATQETMVITNELNGVYVLRARGRATTNDVRGVARTNAMHAAERRALRDILFATLICKDDAQGSSLKPLVPEVNAEQKYHTYFTNFFADKGEWRRYASPAGSRYLATKFSKTQNEYVCEMSVRIDRNALREKLIADQIIRP